MKNTTPYRTKHKVRILTATSLFDGHDVAINLMRRLMQATGCEVIHLGHDRSVQEIVNTAIQEDVNAIAVTSFQGGHNEFFTYMYDLLADNGYSHIKIFGGGGGVILPHEIKALMEYGITRLYSPDDGREMGLQGMINDVVKKSDFPIGNNIEESIGPIENFQYSTIARLISSAENFSNVYKKYNTRIDDLAKKSITPILGITGTGGSGKSSLIDEIVKRFLRYNPNSTLGILSVDPTKRKTGGALLGDRIRMNSINDSRVFMRSMATRQANLALSSHIGDAIKILQAAKFDLIILETSGIGQSDTEITDYSHVSMYVMTPEFGAASQLEKIDMLDFADVVAMNKFDKNGAEDALKAVKKQYQRNHHLWDKDVSWMPVFETKASFFNDPGVDLLYSALIDKINKGRVSNFCNGTKKIRVQKSNFLTQIIPKSRSRYLSEIGEIINTYNQEVIEQSKIGELLYGMYVTLNHFANKKITISPEGLAVNLEEYDESKKNFIRILWDEWTILQQQMSKSNWETIVGWQKKIARYKSDHYEYIVRNKTISIITHIQTLSNNKIQKLPYQNTIRGEKY